MVDESPVDSPQNLRRIFTVSRLLLVETDGDLAYNVLELKNSIRER